MSKNDLRDKLNEDELDLSMMSLTEVPVKEIASLPRAHKIDLSNNRIVSLPQIFAPSLQHITQLELGSNKLTELPNNIGCLLNLRHLDLYNNQLEDLPVSVSQLRSLKWLDVKGNPLKAELRRAAGDCLNSKECEIAAKNIILHLKQVQSIMEKQKQRKLKEERDKEAAQKMIEEQEKAKKRADKKAAKEKRKLEQVEFNKNIINGNGNIDASSTIDSGNHTRLSGSSSSAERKSSGGWSVLGWLNLTLLMIAFGALGAGIYIYAEGDLSVKGIQAAYPKLVKNGKFMKKIVQDALELDHLKHTANNLWNQFSELMLSGLIALEQVTGDLSPLLNSTREKASFCYNVVSTEAYQWYSIIYDGCSSILEKIDYDYIWSTLQLSWKFIQEQYLVICEELSKNEAVSSVFKNIGGFTNIASDYAQEALNVTVTQLSIFSHYVQKEGPVYLEALKENANMAFDNVRQSVEELMK